jgi:hypothetical protein
MFDLGSILAEARRDPTLQNTLDIDALLRAGAEEDADNETEVDDLETLQEMAEGVVAALRAAQLPPEVVSDYFQRLADYRVIDALHELKPGHYVRWLRREPGEHETTRPRKLVSGGSVGDILIEDDTVVVKVHIFPRGWVQKLRYDDHVFFRKLTDDEKMMFMAQDLLEG